MRAPGKIVVDEFYVHLSSLDEVQNEKVIFALHRIKDSLPSCGELEPNVAKINLRSGRVSLLVYRDFFEAPFPELTAAWIYQPNALSPSSFRRYDETPNPPILHRKELLVAARPQVCV
jgi:hypothetical protein